jgi:hypothetical protein
MTTTMMTTAVWTMTTMIAVAVVAAGQLAVKV